MKFTIENVTLINGFTIKIAYIFRAENYKFLTKKLKWFSVQKKQKKKFNRVRKFIIIL